MKPVVLALRLAAGVLVASGIFAFPADDGPAEASESAWEDEAGSGGMPGDILLFCGKIKSMDFKEEILVVTGEKGKDVEFRFSPETEVIREGKEMKLEKLKKGDDVCIMFFEEEWGRDIYQIVVRGKSDRLFECEED